MVSCYQVFELNPQADGPPSTPTMGRPHLNKGVNVLYCDYSVRWIPRPNRILKDSKYFFATGANNFPQTHPGWPHNPSYPNTSENGNCFDSDWFWPFVNQMY
jgi:hypothetical protein